MCKSVCYIKRTCRILSEYMKFSKTTLSVFFSIVAMLAVFVCVKIVQADTASNGSGYLWSSNIGWIKLNNCDDPTDGTTCSGVGYGINISPTSPNTITGYAWSSNIGWITFNDSTCPTNGCTPGAFADFAHPNSDSSINIKGWARACSVYDSGCSGAYKGTAGAITSSPYLGTWDGYIALDSGSGGGTGGVWGLRINSDHTISNYAWGSQVIGWIKSISAKVFFANITGLCYPGDADPACNNSGSTTTYCATTDPQFAWDATGSTSCSILEQGAGAVPVAVTSKTQGGSLATDGKYYFTVNLPVSGATTTYTLSCTGGPQAVNVQKVVTTCAPVTTCPAGQTLNSSGVCVTTTTTCPAGQTLNSSGNCVATAPATKPKPIFNEF